MKSIENRIIAIGGGEIEEKETFFIDQEIVRAANKKSPKLLIIPTASKEEEKYIQNIIQVYGIELGCSVDILYLIKGLTSKERARDMILDSDIIYVGGGHTGYMLEVWKKYSVDKALSEAYKKGVILSGLSAGAICWFESGIGLVSGLYGPHYNKDDMREDFNRFVYSSRNIGIALEDGCAIDFKNDEYRIIKSNNDSKAYRVYRVDNRLIRDELKNSEQFQLISSLFNI